MTSLRTLSLLSFFIVVVAAPMSLAQCAAASSNNYGAGFAGTNGVPSFGLDSAPVLGTSPNIVAGNSRGVDTVGVVVLGLVSGSAPTALGGNILVQPLYSIVLPVIPVAGASIPFSLASDPVFCGIEIFAQLIVFDPGAASNFSFSEGLRMVMGS